MNSGSTKKLALATICVALFIGGVLPTCSVAQDEERRERDRPEAGLWWVSAGLGIGDPLLLLQGGLSINIERGALYQIAYNSSAELNPLGGPTSTINAVSFAIGSDLTNTGVRTALFVGPAILWGKGPPKNDRPSYSSVGLVLNGQIITGWGIGLDLYANVNPVMSTAGARIVFQIGPGNGRKR